ncbi:zf-TFIIB domain-containing protein [Paenibacillus sp. N1-5-1-14]|uniref:TFIIB-type zinc ribbon-containing protein n=1 Tax=Paenibacillus radicibacter TaxID=2972488 RepID=UPI0021591415|nr:zf-TFIIB domain-containing protein [Paenibacillus radicibacter]MCR8642712.1 zf-TFIIB domain-containing protein [Paenibacillus radicibacter]
MNCPVCDGVRMREVMKDGVSIDTCPECKGIWLDRGELEKLRARSESHDQWDTHKPNPNYKSHDHDHDHDYDKDKHGYKKKKSGFDLFDLF